MRFSMVTISNNFIRMKYEIQFEHRARVYENSSLSIDKMIITCSQVHDRNPNWNFHAFA